MFRRADDVPNQMTDTVKVQSALDLSINQGRAQGPIRFVSQGPLGALALPAVLLGDGS